MIGVNNRNLKTFEVDFNNTFKLRKLVPDNIIFVSESGIKTREDIIKLKEHKVNAVLIGETFMKSENKILEIQKLRVKNLKIKICGIKNENEAKIINECMPDIAGFVFASGKRQIDINKAKILKKIINPEIETAGIFVEQNEDEILEIYNEKIIDIIQLHGDYDERTIKNLKEKTNAKIIKVIRVKEDFYKIETLADFILFDAYSKDKYGGLNKTFDWNIKIISNVPYFVAGGINESNVVEMAEKLAPYGVDISSGVEVDGFKTKEKVFNIIKIIKEELNI